MTSFTWSCHCTIGLRSTFNFHNRQQQQHHFRLSRKTGSRGSSVSIVTRLRDGRPGFESQQSHGFFFLATASRPALGPTQPPIQWAPVVPSPGTKEPPPGREAHQSPPSTAEVKNAWSYTPTTPIRLHGVVSKHKDNFTFSFIKNNWAASEKYPVPISE
jgi:hypothetical protein